MKFAISILNLETAKAEVIFATDNEEDMRMLRDIIQRKKQEVRCAGASPIHIDTAPVKLGRKGKNVHVISVSEDTDTILKPGDAFDNANQMSTVLGFTYNAVSMALNVADKKGETTASLKGVEFCYEENIPGAKV